MDRAIAPRAATSVLVVQSILRNVVPLIGILAFGWSAVTVLELYFVDTVLGMSVIAAGVMATFAAVEDGVTARINGELSALAAGLFTSLVVAVPLGIPLFMLLSADGYPLGESLSDRRLWTGALVQAAAAAWSYAGLWIALRTHSPDELRMKRRFALVFLRWIAVLAVVIAAFAISRPHRGSEPVLRHAAPVLVVIAYFAITIVAEVAPDRFLRAMPGGAEDAAPIAGGAKAPGVVPRFTFRAATARKRRR